MKEGALIRFLLVGLPAGLLVLGVGAMFYSQIQAEKEPADPNEAIRLEAASLQQRPVGEEDLSRSLTILSGQLADRSFANAEGLEKTAFWLESTLGGGNIGYVVERHGFETSGRELRNLIAELPGRDRRKEIIVVGVRYDETGADGSIAAFLALARALAGEAQQRTIRFVAFADGGNAVPAEQRGSYQYAMRCRSRGEAIIAMLSLDAIGGPGQESRVVFSGEESERYFVDAAQGAFSTVSSRSASGILSSRESFRSGEGAAAGFARAELAAVSVVEESQPTGPMVGMNPEALLEVTRGLETLIRVWANP